MKVIKEILNSKKALAAILAIVVQIIGYINPELALVAEQVGTVIIGYIVGQGIADLGKEKAKVEKE